MCSSRSSLGYRAMMFPSAVSLVITAELDDNTSKGPICPIMPNQSLAGSVRTFGGGAVESPAGDSSAPPRWLRGELG